MYSCLTNHQLSPELERKLERFLMNTNITRGVNITPSIILFGRGQSRFRDACAFNAIKDPYMHAGLCKGGVGYNEKFNSASPWRLAFEAYEEIAAKPMTRAQLREPAFIEAVRKRFYKGDRDVK